MYPNWGQYKRADLIGQSSYIKNNDVVIFNEAFDNGASDKLLSNVKKEYPYQTPVLGRSQSGWDKTEGSYSSTVAEDGGVAIVVNILLKKKSSMFSKAVVDSIMIATKALFIQK